MAFIGNRGGPKKSEVVARLGFAYFGITPEELAVEVENYEEDESRGVVDPVYRDSHGRWFLHFNAPNGRTQRYYLDEHGYHLEGDVLEIDERSEH